MESITRSAVELRLDNSNWPAGLETSTSSGPMRLRKAFDTARDLFAQFSRVVETNASNRHLTPVGQQAALARWADDNLPRLRAEFEKAREVASQVEANLVKVLLAEYVELPTELHDVALLQEVRSWISSLPETQRAAKVMQITASGDRTPLRALMTVPSYLAPLPQDQLTIVRDKAAKLAHPDRYEKLDTFKKMVAATERAVSGVTRFVEQEATRNVEVEAARAQSLNMRQRSPQPA